MMRNFDRAQFPLFASQRTWPQIHMSYADHYARIDPNAGTEEEGPVSHQQGSIRVWLQKLCSFANLNFLSPGLPAPTCRDTLLFTANACTNHLYWRRHSKLTGYGSR